MASRKSRFTASEARAILMDSDSDLDLHLSESDSENIDDSSSEVSGPDSRGKL